MIALLCHTLGYPYQVLSKDGMIFSGSSSKNQNRLHLGYHYPRSADTIKECQVGYAAFMENLKKYVRKIDNYYLIDNKSHISYAQYQSIFECRETPLDIDLELASGLIEAVFDCDERQINHEAVRTRFSDLFSSKVAVFDPQLLELDGDKIEYDGQSYDYFFNCTYGQSLIGFPMLNLHANYELCLTLVYEHLTGDATYGVTVMDGGFFSLFPLTGSLYTLTHVKHTPLKTSSCLKDLEAYAQVAITTELIGEKRKMFEVDVVKYFPNFSQCFKYHHYFLSYKCKFDHSTDDRSLRTFVDGKRMMFVGGKITGVYEMLKIITKAFGLPDFKCSEFNRYL